MRPSRVPPLTSVQSAMLIQCGCGEVYAADEHAIGGWLRCRCGRIVQVPRAAGRPAAPLAPLAASKARRETREVATWWLVRLSWAYLAVAATVCVVLWTLSDRWWPATLYLFGPRWVLLLPLIALVPAALRFRVSLLVPLAIAAAVVLLPVMGLRLGWRSWLGANDTATALRVVTLNTDGALGPAVNLPFLVEEWRADIVALQECGDALREAVQRMTEWHSHVAGSLCLLSRYPIRDSAVTNWDDLAAAREMGIGGSSQAAGYVIQTPQNAIRFVNLHLETARKGLEGIFELDVQRITENTMLRDVESRRTRAWLGRGDAPVIIAGDFNMPVESAIYRRDWSEFRNAFSQAGVGFGMTRDNGWIQVRIDHVLTAPEWRAKQVVVGPVIGRDHRPVIAELAWTRPAK